MSKKKTKWRGRLSQRAKMQITAGVGGGLVVLLLIVWLFMINQTPGTAEPTLSEAQKSERDRNVSQVQRDEAIRQSASDALKEGNGDRADKVYADAIKSEKDTARKVELYVDQSRLLLSSGKAEDAIKIARQAETQTSDKFIIADWLARLYEHQKQYALAIQYYSLASQNINSPNNVYMFDKKHYDAQIARVVALEKK